MFVRYARLAHPTEYLLYKSAGLGNLEGKSTDFAVYPRIPTITKDKEAMGAWVSFYRNWISREFFSNCKSC